jgi:hypothetical protein
MRSGTKWQFRTKRFRVSLEVTRDHGYQYDGDDEDGETQAKLDSGEYVAFDSRVIVELDGEEIGADSLGGSVYADGEEEQFWTAHRDPDPMNRNCSIMRAARGERCVICHYFPDMVRLAIAEARQHIREQPAAPYIRESA